ncbi:MAG: Fic family protein [Firmicutes bacterium]|nr:Fic family protein [Bacillota bacterium]
MYQELQKLKVKLQTGRPYSRQMTEQIRELDLQDFICCGMLLEGDDLTRGDIIGMIDGEMPKQVSLKQCMAVRNYQALMDEFHNCLDLSCSLDLKLLLRFYSILTGKDDGFRRSNYTAVDFKYVPPHSTEIENRLNQLFKNVYRSNLNEIRNAACVHCGILAVYPFEEDSGVMARIAMNYYLMEKGYSPVSLRYNYSEYLSTMTECLRDDNDALFFWGLERAVFNKLTQVIQMIESEEE